MINFEKLLNQKGYENLMEFIYHDLKNSRNTKEQIENKLYFFKLINAEFSNIGRYDDAIKFSICKLESVLKNDLNDAICCIDTIEWNLIDRTILDCIGTILYEERYDLFATDMKNNLPLIVNIEDYNNYQYTTDDYMKSEGE